MNTSISIEMANKSKNSIASTIQKYSDQISGFVKSRVSNTDDAKDILQDVWFHLSRLTNLDEIESVSGWLYRVARNRITDSYRKKKDEHLEDYLVDSEDGELSFKDILLADDSGDPELSMFKELFWNELSAALDELPPNQKEAYMLNEIEDLTLQEIADKTGVSIKTIISRKGYAVKHLRQRLNHLYNEIND